MKIEDFFSGNYISRLDYKSFKPENINQPWIISDAEINTLLEEANYKLGSLDAYSEMVPDVNVFIRMHVVKEATYSNKIEGTQTHVDEAVLKERDIEPEKKDDWQEVQNYIEAINYGIERLEALPLSSRLFKETHKILLQSVRGKEKLPGEYRRSQNWIGGASLKDALFIPPVYDGVDSLMGDLENFINNDQIKVPHLIRIAIAHYQFETIHPFLDGNGRLGRLLITLYLVQTNKLRKPTLYLSDFFSKHKHLYYDNLMKVRLDSNLTQWIKFFLVAIIETSDDGITTFKKIMALRERIIIHILPQLGRKLPLATTFINYLYSNPVVSALTVEEEMHISKPTANALISDFERLGILKEKTGLKKNRLYGFEEYLRLFEIES